MKTVKSLALHGTHVFALYYGLSFNSEYVWGFGVALSWISLVLNLSGIANRNEDKIKEAIIGMPIHRILISIASDILICYFLIIGGNYVLAALCSVIFYLANVMLINGRNP